MVKAQKMSRWDLEAVCTRAQISVQLDYRQYLLLMSLVQEWEQQGRIDYGTRDMALNLRQRARNDAWVLSGRWPQRVAVPEAA